MNFEQFVDEFISVVLLSRILLGSERGIWKPQRTLFILLNKVKEFRHLVSTTKADHRNKDIFVIILSSLFM